MHTTAAEPERRPAARPLPLSLEREPDPPAWLLERFREVTGP